MRRKLPSKEPVPPAVEKPPARELQIDYPKFLTPEWFLRLTCGDEDAARVAETFVRDCHLTDDLVDGDKLVTDATLVVARLLYLSNLTLSPFWQQNQTSLMPLFIQGAAAFLDANRWEKHTDVRYRRAADVLKAYYAEVIWHIGYICGGWSNMRLMQEEFRNADFDCKE